MLRPYLTVNSSKGLLSTYLHHAARMVFPQYTYEINAPNTPIFLLLNLLTFGLWGKLGRLGHYALDAVLISTILAGMRRSTGLTVRSERITGENTEMNKWVTKYLGVGEWVLDQSVAFAGTSKFFERTR
ncbi:hypothetical protein F5B17DRAFT_435390 [Nemania serpens]|nr:hypothetical protein F5B17DRAFT_435390 [Nemania serpens]